MSPYVCNLLRSSSAGVRPQVVVLSAAQNHWQEGTSVSLPSQPFPAATQPLLFFLPCGVYLPPFPRMDRRRPLIHYCPFPEFSSSTQFVLLFSDFLSLFVTSQSVLMAEMVSPSPSPHHFHTNSCLLSLLSLGIGTMAYSLFIQSEVPYCTPYLRFTDISISDCIID